MFIMGVAAAGPVVWHAGSSGWTQRGLAEISSWLVLAAGFFWHRFSSLGRRLPLWNASGGETVPALIGCSGLAVVFWTIWSIGSSNRNPEAKWNLLPVLALGCFFLPWIYGTGCVIIRALALRLKMNRMSTLAGFWSVAAGALYVAGMWRQQGFSGNNYFAFGGVAVVLFMRYTLGVFEPVVKKFAPAVAEHVSGGSGKPYFFCAILALLGTAGLAWKMEPVAERLAIVVYYCFVIGVVIEVFELSRSVESVDSVSLD